MTVEHSAIKSAMTRLGRVRDGRARCKGGHNSDDGDGDGDDEGDTSKKNGVKSISLSLFYVGQMLSLIRLLSLVGNLPLRPLIQPMHV